MPKLDIEKKTIKKLLTDETADFLIPDYQRPYAWTEDQCEKLWEDLCRFAFPDNDSEKFDHSEEFFLGPIVIFTNEQGKMEVIDGQQRLTTIMLLLRAFYPRFVRPKDKNSQETRKTISQCIWKANGEGDPDENKPKIYSAVASADDRDEFHSILRTGQVTSGHSRYAMAFRFFQEKIAKFVEDTAMYTALLVDRILNNVILLPIATESQDTALRIFTTLNDRGLQLSDADIFKSQFYKFFSDRGEKKGFIERWKALEKIAKNIVVPMDEIFARYMYYERAKQGNRSTTTEALRDFYGRDSYKLLKDEETFKNLEAIADFWNDVAEQDPQRFSGRVLRRLFVLNYAPNGMWTYMVSAWFMRHKDEDGMLDDEAFHAFLHKITAFIWAYAIERPGVNSLRTPVYPELIRIVNGEEVEFAEHRFDRKVLRDRFMVPKTFSNNRPITRSMLAWWAFQDDEQPLLGLDTVFEIEHIYAKKRAEVENVDKSKLEVLGNKALLEERINIRASDYRFEDKKRHYLGFESRRGRREGTRNHELRRMAEERQDFTMEDAGERTKKIIDSFMDYLGAHGLLKDNAAGARE